MPKTDQKHIDIISPFDDETQALLIQVDNACASQMQRIMEDMEKASLAGDTEYKMDLESLVWSRVIRAYGILMNRSIDAGWVKGIHTTRKSK